MSTTATKRKTATKLIPAVAYIRMSSDQQEDSPERQRAEITAMAEKGGYKILRWYEDHGLTGTESKNRPQFQKLLKDAPKGGFEAILMHEQSRFGRETALQFASHLNTLNECGVSLVTRKGKVDPNDIGGFITTMVEQFGNRAESENIAHRVTSGKRQKIMNGVWIGPSPFGYDRSILDANGKEIHRVKHEESFVRSSSFGCRLMPSRDRKVIAGIQDVFKRYIDGESLKEIAMALNATGCRTKFGNKFKICNIARMVRHPVYYGAQAVSRIERGSTRSGKFCKIFESETIVNEKAHEGIVSKQMFDAAQGIANSRVGGQRRGKDQKYLLSGLVICGHCGQKMYGGTLIVHTPREGGDVSRIIYRCNRGPSSIEPGEGVCVQIRGDILEREVLNAINTHVLTEENLQRCDSAYQASLEGGLTLSANHHTDEIRANIERASKNLALADDASDFSAISKQLRAWRKELKSLGDVAETRKRSPLQGLGIEGMKDTRDFLTKADRGKLSDALRGVIDSIVVTKVAPKSCLKTAKLSFHPESYSGADIEISAESLRIRNGGLLRVPPIVRGLCRPATIQDVMAATGLTYKTIAGYMKQLADQKLLKKTAAGFVCR